MADTETDKVDSVIAAENVSFLSNCFDNSFVLQSSLNCVKNYVAGTQSKPVTSFKDKAHANGNSIRSTQQQNKQKRNLNASCKDSPINLEILSQPKEKDRIFQRKLQNWGLPKEITRKYANKNITEMFDWQIDCLGNPKVLLEGKNLVYSAPTSAGKTLVAEILTIKTILERQKKVILILPFVSIVREKMFYLQDILTSSGIRVEGFMGSQSPPGGLKAVHLAICTIEKANSLINKLIEEGSIAELGAIIVDELHLLGDSYRGYILELLLTKVKYLSSKFDEIKIQVIGMSATLPNLKTLSNWLDAELYITEFRPIPLDEYCLVGNKYYDKSCNYLGSLKLDHSSKDICESDNVLSICLDTIKEGCSVLVFCMTKNRCENLAQNIATSFYKIGCAKNEYGVVLREQLKSDGILEVLEQLQNCPVGLDQVIKNIISFGVAYHHAGLTFDERDIIEGAFKSGAIRVLVATSTLSSGVNLPARKVIIRSPVFQRQPINILTYKQMVGRAGRMGKDTKGESILICTSAEQKIGFDLLMGKLDPVKSCIDSEDKFMRAILEMIASQVVCTRSEIELYSQCTLLFYQQDGLKTPKLLLDESLKELINFELIRVQANADNNYVATPLGKACLSSSMAPGDGISLFCELQRARQCLVLETDLHLIYLVTPYSVSNQWNDIDWLHLLSLWESLTVAMKRVGELVGVQESFIICSLRGTKNSNNSQKLNIHKRFYTALALQDLVNEASLSEVAAKFQCARGFLQGLQQAAATFAGMVTAFCHQLGWKSMEMLVSQFQDRLHFGIHSELLELMKLASLNGMRARTLYDAGFETIASIASANAHAIENTLHKAAPFQSEKERENDDDRDLRKRNKMRNIWITGCCGMTAKEAAENLILEARKYLQQEIGVTEINWANIDNSSGILNKTTDRHIYVDIEHNYIKKISGEEPQQELKSETEIKFDPKNSGNDIESFEMNGNSNCKAQTGLKIGLSAIDVKPVNELPKVSCNNICLNTIKNNQSENIKLLKVVEEKQNVHILESDVLKCNNTSINNDNAINNKFVKEDSNRNPPVKDLVIWDSLIFSETAFDNISKVPNSTKYFSPNISFGESEEKDEGDLVNQVINNKDVSLFSSDGNNSSLFEDSLPLDLIPNTVEENIENINSNKDVNIINNKDVKDKNGDNININSQSLLNAFRSSIIEIDEEEDIKLVYEDDRITEKKHKIDTIVTQNNYNVTNNKYTKRLSVKNGVKIPIKRHAGNSNISQVYDKKVRNEKGNNLQTTISHEIILNCPKSDKYTIKLRDQIINCYAFRDTDIFDNINIVEKNGIAAVILNIKSKPLPCTNVIGSNICKNNRSPSRSGLTDQCGKTLNGLAFCLDQDLCIYFDLASLDKTLRTMYLELIETRLLANTFFKIKTASAKFMYVQLKKFLGIDLLSSCVDISIGEWLLHSEEKMYNIIDLTKQYCGMDLSSVNIIVSDQSRKYKSLDHIESSCVQAWCVWALAEKQKYSMAKYNILAKTLDTETHVAKILARCECNGITVDKDLASRLLVDVKKSLDTLNKKATKMCGRNFNFHSSKSVAKALRLHDNGRKTSTKKSVLAAHNSPVAHIVMFYRKLSSILTKTLYPLTEQAYTFSADDRISPSYTMFTCTGRISMHEPNLQNVPRTFSVPLQYLSSRDDLQPCGDLIEFNCRNIFKAAPGFIFVSADYCQLEMRILTHYCKDAVLTEIMRSDVDIFKSIAASWTDVPEEEVDDDLRQKTKQLCYGILYGMGNRTLSEHLEVTELEAGMFLDAFHRAYPGIKAFTLALVQACRDNKYVQTLMRRRRHLPDIASRRADARSAAERQAINTTIQGSAADIAKAAMCAIDSRADGPRLVLQMHDELIYEVPEANERDFAVQLKEVMENTVVLNVPLPVKVKSGHTWGSLEEMKF